LVLVNSGDSPKLEPLSGFRSFTFQSKFRRGEKVLLLTRIGFGFTLVTHQS